VTGEAGDSPEDFLFVERDEDYERRAREEAEFYDTPRLLNIDAEMPVTDAYRNEIYTGAPDIPWYETIQRYGSFRRGCALGAGGTNQRSSILELNPELHLTIYDISTGSLAEMDRDLAARFPGRVTTEAVDLNFVDLEEGRFDLIISSGCVHHLTNLEHVAFQINRSLAPNGYVFLEDYVGEAKFQFSPEKRRRFEEALDGARRRHRALKYWQVVWPDLSDWSYSAFEAMRSDETFDVFRRYLTEVDVRAGGAILGSIMFVRPPAPLGEAASIGHAVLRRLVAVRNKLLKWQLSKSDSMALLANELIPIDREVSAARSLTPTYGFAIYRKRMS